MNFEEINDRHMLEKPHHKKDFGLPLHEWSSASLAERYTFAHQDRAWLIKEVDRLTALLKVIK